MDRGLGRAAGLRREGSAGRGGDRRRSGSRQPWDHPLFQDSSDTEQETRIFLLHKNQRKEYLTKNSEENLLLLLTALKDGHGFFLF